MSESEVSESSTLVWGVVVVVLGLDLWKGFTPPSELVEESEESETEESSSSLVLFFLEVDGFCGERRFGGVS